jgi:hypothetical protein
MPEGWTQATVKRWEKYWLLLLLPDVAMLKTILPKTICPRKYPRILLPPEGAGPAPLPGDSFFSKDLLAIST